MLLSGHMTVFLVLLVGGLHDVIRDCTAYFLFCHFEIDFNEMAVLVQQDENASR